jgi:hypothetical protein
VLLLPGVAEGGGGGAARLRESPTVAVTVAVTAVVTGRHRNNASELSRLRGSPTAAGPVGAGSTTNVGDLVV